MTGKYFLEKRVGKGVVIEFLLWRNDEQAKPFVHAVLLIGDGTQFFVLDPRTNTLVGPFGSKEESMDAVKNGAFLPYYKGGVGGKVNLAESPYGRAASPWFTNNAFRWKIVAKMKECGLSEEVITDSMPREYTDQNGNTIFLW